MIEIMESLIQMLYEYKSSRLYIIHIALMVILLMLQIQNAQKNPRQTNCSQRIDYVDYSKYVKNNTAKEVGNLQKTLQFQRYLQLRQDPNSRFYVGNRNYDDVDNIVFSDDSDGGDCRGKEKDRLL